MSDEEIMIKSCKIIKKEDISEGLAIQEISFDEWKEIRQKPYYCEETGEFFKEGGEHEGEVFFYRAYYPENEVIEEENSDLEELYVWCEDAHKIIKDLRNRVVRLENAMEEMTILLETNQEKKEEEGEIYGGRKLKKNQWKALPRMD